MKNAQHHSSFYRQTLDFRTLPDEAFIKFREVCAITATSPAVLQKRVQNGDFPPPVRHGNLRVWPWGEVKAWLRMAAENRQGDAA